ncbi:hypothetical protein CVV67_22355 [Arthrobacter stackebrandtii]|nr:hypothetical protein CVV67_22355 [Arthrobacter stackebrandtii]
MGAGKPAKQAAQGMARASPVFAGMPAPTVRVQPLSAAQYLWERVYPRKGRHSHHTFTTHLPSRAPAGTVCG